MFTARPTNRFLLVTNQSKSRREEKSSAFGSGAAWAPSRRPFISLGRGSPAALATAMHPFSLSIDREHRHPSRH